MLFIDSTLRDQSGNGFFSGVVSSITNIFSGAEDPNVTQKRVEEIEKEISEEARLMQIDISNENLRGIQESYDVTEVPYLIIFKRGIVVLREKLGTKEAENQEIQDKVRQILNITPTETPEEENNDVVIEENVPVESVPEASSENVATAPEEVSSSSPVATTNVEEVSAEPIAAEAPEEQPTVEEVVVLEPVKPIEEETPAESEEPAIEESPDEIIILEDENAPLPDERPAEANPTTPAEEPAPPTETKLLVEPDKAFATDISGDEDNSNIPRSFELGPRPGEVPVLDTPNDKETVTQQITLAPGERPQTVTVNKTQQ